MFTYIHYRDRPSLLEKFRPKDLVPIACGCCGQSYAKTRKDIQDNIRKHVKQSFCSRECVSSSQTLKRHFSCKNCGIDVARSPSEVKKSNEIFCSQSCAGTFNNQIRGRAVYEKSAATLRETLKQKFANRTAKAHQEKKPAAVRVPKEKMIREPKIWGPFSSINVLTCAHSGQAFVSRRRQKYHPDFAHLYSRDGRARYAFCFNVFHYPDLFDLNLIAEHGWYEVGGRHGARRRAINKRGVSRDHRISVSDAIRCGYDPFYITHPLNCRIMIHLDNKRKHTQSDLAYEDLVRMVDEFESARSRS